MRKHVAHDVGGSTTQESTFCGLKDLHVRLEESQGKVRERVLRKRVLLFVLGDEVGNAPRIAGGECFACVAKEVADDVQVAIHRRLVVIWAWRRVDGAAALRAQVLLAIDFESLREMRAEDCGYARHPGSGEEERVESGTSKSSEVLRLAKVVRAERERDLAAIRLRQLAAEVVDPLA